MVETQCAKIMTCTVLQTNKTGILSSEFRNEGKPSNSSLFIGREGRLTTGKFYVEFSFGMEQISKKTKLVFLFHRGSLDINITQNSKQTLSNDDQEYQISFFSLVHEDSISF